jgi:predicted secreted acid phosphatase
MNLLEAIAFVVSESEEAAYKICERANYSPQRWSDFINKRQSLSGDGLSRIIEALSKEDRAKLIKLIE